MSNSNKSKNGWQEISLSEIAQINPRESLKKGIVGKSVAMEMLAPYRRKLTGYEIKSYKGGTKFRNKDTLLARITPCLENGKTAFIDILEENEVGFGSTEYIVIRKRENLSDAKFLYYFCISPRFREEAIKSMTGTSGRQRVQTDLLVNMPFRFPLYKEQKAIASILTSFDDKIELLEEQNKTLEAMAQAIFKEWFVNFRFPGAGKMIDSELGMIPEGWNVDNIGKFVNIKGGTTPSTKNPVFWNGDINWTSPKDLSQRKETFLLNTDKTITLEGLKKISSGLLPKGTLLFSSRAPIGYLALSNIDVAINQGFIAFLPGAQLSNFFMFNWLKQNADIVVGAANGSTFLEISKSSFKSISTVIPKKEIIRKFDISITPIFQKILNNLLQIQTLTQFRDGLLPKLMSGELRVKL